MIRALAPAYLLLLPCLIWFWWQARGIGAGRIRTAIHCAIALLLILAMSQLQVRRGQGAASVMFLVDASESTQPMREQLISRANGLLPSLRAGDQAGLIAFGRAAQVDRPATASRVPFGPIAVDVSGTATDIEAALRLARMSLPATGARHVVLLSDGHQTHGDGMREAARAAQEGIAIDAWLPDTASVQAINVTSLSGPATARTGQPFALTAVVEGAPATQGELTIERDHEVQVRSHIVLSAAGRATAVFSDTASTAGLLAYTARIQPAENGSPLVPDATLPAAGTAVTIVGPSRLLHVSSRSAGLDRSSAPGFRIDHVAPPSLPRSAAALDAYDAVILDDVPPDAIDAGQAAALVPFVEQRGGGLLVLGSTRSLDVGFFPGTPLGDLLPVDLRPRAGERSPQAALVVVYDKSGSMDDRVEGASKIEYARQGIQKILEVLPATDAVGVIAFDSTPTEVVPLRPGQDPRAVAARVRDIQPGGSTAIAPAMELARRWLSSSDAAQFSQRHVLLVSDGRSSEDDARRLEALAKGPFELSVVALGADADRRFLARLAEASGGRAYLPDRISDLPLILAREAARVAGGRVVEGMFTPRAMPHAISSSFAGATLPLLGGYVVGAAKPRAEIVLQSHLEDPILAGWKYGLGRVAVYTADWQGAWSSRFRASPTVPPLLSLTLRWLARPLEQGSLYTTVRPSGDSARLIVDTDNDATGYKSLLEVRASLRSPSGETRTVAVAESEPGRYETELPVAEQGAYAVEIDASSSDGLLSERSLRGFHWQPGAEQRERGINRALLASLVQATGGMLIDGSNDPFATRPAGYAELRRPLLAAAFLLFLGALLMPTIYRLKTRTPPQAHPHQEAA